MTISFVVVVADVVVVAVVIIGGGGSVVAVVAGWCREDERESDSLKSSKLASPCRSSLSIDLFGEGVMVIDRRETES